MKGLLLFFFFLQKFLLSVCDDSKRNYEVFINFYYNIGTYYIIMFNSIEVMVMKL